MKKLHLALAIIALAALLILPATLKNYGVHLFTTWLVFIIAVMGLNLTVGYAGQ
ncbi:MAG: branched-chain amino acid ABC transporter permease, partial [Rubrivivax sp.]|nr:branched-chain amino acid ABC transporter permease [Rubrivivax sp.]